MNNVEKSLVSDCPVNPKLRWTGDVLRLNVEKVTFL